MARERLQGSFGTQRNLTDRVNVCEFDKDGLTKARFLYSKVDVMWFGNMGINDKEHSTRCIG